MCEIMERYMAEEREKVSIRAVVNMLMLGIDERKVQELYPDQFEAGKRLFEEEKKGTA